MSKKKKVSPGKSGKKTSSNKPVKKSAKPMVKKAASKKSPQKPSKIKSVAAKVVKKVSKIAPKKSVPAKKILKKVVKAVSKVVKAVSKKTLPKSSGKNVQKPAVKSSASKSQAITAKSQPVAKLAASSNGSSKHGKTEVKASLHIAAKKDSRPMPAPAPEKSKKPEEPATKKQLAERKANDVLAITNTIPVKQKHEISPSKIASISHSITNPVKKTDSYAVKPEKEPNGKFEMEFVVHSSAEMLYEFLSTPSGLSEWFCDDLNIRNGIYTFIWDDQLQQARLLKTVDLQLVRFQWVDKTDGSYFEFRIQRDDLTNDIALIITDFAETASERESSKLLWHSQIEKLMHVIGSIF